MVASDRIILHWLEESRAQRIVWLFEELNLKYEIKVYERINQRSPPNAVDIHPLGKFPIVEIIKSNGKNLKLVETGHIMSYILKNYDNDKKLLGNNEDDEEQVNYFLHYSEGTLQNLYIYPLIVSEMRKALPYGASYLAGKIYDVPSNVFYKPEIHSNLKFLNDILSRNLSGYFVGNSLTAADIILTFPIYEGIFAKPKSTALIFQETDFEKKYPYLKNWSDKVSKNPTFIKADKLTENALKEFKASK